VTTQGVSSCGTTYLRYYFLLRNCRYGYRRYGHWWQKKEPAPR